MPSVFLGSFIGVTLNHKVVDPTTQVILFGVTVAWSIQTTWKKAKQLLAKEKAESVSKKLLGDEALKIQSAMNSEEVVIQALTPELEHIVYEEAHHFTGKRMLFTAISFTALFATQLLFKEQIFSS